MMHIKIKHLAALAALVLSLCFIMARAAHANTLRAVAVEPTFECAGIIATLGATDDPGRATLEVKEQGAAAFRPAHDFVRYDNYHMASSLFDLKPGTAYDVRVTVNGQSMAASFTTRSEFSLPPALRTVNVANTSQLTAALRAAQPGDEIVLAAGNYTGGLSVAASGTVGHPIVIRGNISSAEKAKPVDQRTGLPVINGAGTSPVITVTGSHVVLDSLRIENAALVGVSLKGTGYCTVEGCQVTGRGSGYNQAIYVNGGGKDGGRHLIQENYLQDTGPGTGYGILQHNYAGPGTVIRRNIVTGFHDGINPSGDELDLTDAILPETHPDVLGTWPNQSTDVYENVVRSAGDDDIETDGIAVNERIFRNTLSVGEGNACTNGISIAPVAPGPFFFVRNIVTNFREGGVKYNTASGRGTIRNCFFYHNTFKNDLGTARRGTLLTLWEGNGDGGSPSKNTHFKNNIFLGDKMLLQRLVTTHTPDYNPNLWYSRQASGTLYQWGKSGPYYDSFVAWRNGTGEEPGGFYADPLVDDTTFGLKAGSPAIDRGTFIPGINDSFAGAGPDMGACEYGIATAQGQTPAAAVTYTIAGRIADGVANALAGATVTLAGTSSRSVLSDANGGFQFAGLPAGNYTVTVSRDGYSFDPGKRTLTLTADSGALNFTAVSVSAFSASLADAVGYPNPWKAGNPYSPVVTFKNLTENAKVRIYSLDGSLVREIDEPGKAVVHWDVAGDNVGSGVYLCMITNDRGETKRQKIAVIR